MKYIAPLLALLSLESFAGGSYEQALISQFSRVNDTDYVMVLTPLENGHFTWLGGLDAQCKMFVVLGKYQSQGLFESGYLPEKTAHIQAVNYLSESERKINFGYTGQGFKSVDSNNRCIVESRVLELEVSNDKQLVLSRYNPT